MSHAFFSKIFVLMEYLFYLIKFYLLIDKNNRDIISKKKKLKD